MALKQSVLFSLVLLFVGSNGFSLDRKIPQGNIGLLQDFGPIIAEAIEGILETIPDVIPLPETLVPSYINLTALDIKINNVSLPLKGELNLRNVAIHGLKSTKVPVSTLNINGILNTIPLNLRVTDPEVRLEAEYDVKALLGGILPIRGEGVARISLNLTAGLDVEIKAKLGNPIVMEMPLFDIILGDFLNLKVEIDGLLGNEALSAEISKVIASVLSPIVVDLVDKALGNIEPIVPIIFNSLKLTFQQFLDVINQIVGAIGSGALKNLL